MRIVVVGGRGLIGARLVRILRDHGEDVLPASRTSGVDVVTGAGLVKALVGADAVVDVTDSPSLEGSAALEFFKRPSSNLLEAGAAACVRHHVALSVVGVERLQDGGYFRAKALQEDLVRSSSLPYTIVRSTQFFELVERMLLSDARDAVVRLPPALMQPVAADDVAETLAAVALAKPINGTIELAGSEAIEFRELARQILSAHEDPRDVLAVDDARYYGAALEEDSLLPSPDARIAPSTFGDWLRQFITAD